MNLTRCSQGHFYDADTNSSCPHCQKSAGNDETVAIKRSVDEEVVTMPLTGSKPSERTVAKSTGSDITVPVNGVKAPSAAQDDDGVTIRFVANKESEKEPVVGWLVCVEGAHMGEDFRLTTGRNFIGRATNMHVALTRDKSVSRDKHATVLYEPKKHIFLVQPGESRELCYLNDEIVLSAQEIKRNDVISVGDSKLMFFPCCDAKFNWGMSGKTEEKAENIEN